MGKKRQHASSRDADMTPDTICSLPHCEEAGHQLGCGHALCCLDLLKLTQYATQIKRLLITCPMCRKMEILDDTLVSQLLNETPLRCATFKCACADKHCDRVIPAFLRCCKAHGTYLCESCVGLKNNGSYLQLVASPDGDRDGHGEAHQEDREEESSTPFHTPNWGMTDQQFEDFLRTYKQTREVWTALTETIYRNCRVTPGTIPGDLWSDITSEGPANRSGNLAKFLQAYYSTLARG